MLQGTLSIATQLPFDETLARLEQAVQAEGMLLIAKPSASRNAAARGIHLPGNAVILTFSSDFAVRLLQVSVAAGFEAPLRLYVTENPDGTATVTYRTATALFAPYEVPGLEPIARDLDAVLARIVRIVSAATAPTASTSPPKP